MTFKRSLDKRKILIMMAFFGFALNYLFRNVVYITLLVYDIGSEKAKSEMISGAESKFFYGYCIPQIPIGRMAELFGGKTLCGYGILIASLLTLVMPFAVKVGGYDSLIIINFFMGMSLSGYIPAIFSMSSKWIPFEERGTIFIAYGASQLGASSLSLALNFRHLLSTDVIFIIPASLGIIWSLCWYIFVYDSPLTHPSISREEKHFIVHTKESQGTCYDVFDLPWFEILFDSHVWLICTVHTCYLSSAIFFTRMSSQYVKEMFDLRPLDNSIMISPFYFGFATIFLSGLLMDFLYSKKVPLTVLQKIWTAIGTFIPAFALVGLLWYQNSIELTLFFYVFGLTFSYCVVGGYYTRFLDLAPNFAGTLNALSNCLASFGLAMIMDVIMPSMDSNVRDKQQAWDNKHSLVIALFLTGGTLYTIFGSNYVAEWNVPIIYDAV